MIKIFRTMDGEIQHVNEAQEGCWIALINPTATEILDISKEYKIEVDDLRAPLDEEERSRIEVGDNYTMVLVDVPIIENRNDKDWFGTIPMSIIVTDKLIFTVCLEDTPVLSAFMDGRVRNFFTYMKTRFILQILYKNASLYPVSYTHLDVYKRQQVVPYRLEMQAKTQRFGQVSLYEYWGDMICRQLCKETDCILNLSSKEYALAIERYLEKRISFVTCIFGDLQENKVVVKGTKAKMARGEMVRFLAENKIEDPKEMKNFERLGYHYDKERSDKGTYVFINF